MLALKIVSTVFLGMSCMTAFFKNICVYKDAKNDIACVIISTLYGWLWRTLVIITLWVI